MKKIEELLEDIIENSKVATLRFPRNGIEAQKVLTIKAEILRQFAELEQENIKLKIDLTGCKSALESMLLQLGQQKEFLHHAKQRMNAMTEEIQCPVCGYYCLGNGGHGCIDKPSLVNAKSDAQKFHELTGLELPDNYTAADILNNMKEFCVQSKYNKFLWRLGVDCVGRTQVEAINNFIEKYILNPPALLKKAVEFLKG